jgi:hypothetical protein
MRVLTESNRVVGRAFRLSQTRPVGKAALDQAQGLVEIEVARRCLQRGEQG